MIFQFLFVFAVGVVVGVYIGYRLVATLVEHGIKTGKIEFKVKK